MITRCLFPALCLIGQFAAPGAIAQEAAPALTIPSEPRPLEERSLPLQALGASLQAGVDYASRTTIDPAADYIAAGFVWLRDGSVSALDTMASGVATTFDMAVDTVASLPDLPNRSARRFVDSMRGERLEEFGEMVTETGFELSEISVGLELIPHFSFHFLHRRDLTPEELEEASANIEAFIAEESKAVGYVETVVLRSLLRAGTYAGDVRLRTVEVAIFPLPGVTLAFDPLHAEYDIAERNAAAARNAQRALELEAELEERLEALETALLEFDQSTTETINEAPAAEAD